MSLDLKEQLQRTLGDNYTIERELGGGGMSRVLLAVETRFGRKVVIKVLPPDVSGAWLERAFEARTLWMKFLHLEPRLQRLRGTQRFEELLKRIGIAPVRGRVQGVPLNPTPRTVEERARNA